MTRPLRALLLAAGLGTRLRPITETTPKCLVEVGGKPLLGRWLKQLEDVGCEAVLINTHYLADQVEDFLQRRPPKDMRVQIFHEPELLGTAGTLLANRAFFNDATGLMIHADNVMLDPISKFLKAHQSRKLSCLLTMLTFLTNEPESCGVLEVDQDLIAQSFYEKIPNPPSDLANGALYAFDPPFLDFLINIQSHKSDFSTQVIPLLLGKIQTWPASMPYIDIGTQIRLNEAQKLFSL